ncbi:hypothetical protein DF268_31840 [Streptomyces sp. V2]|uniref:WXG100 family type VII secretion target n=1 Tax=Streptomyces TaxID=1883 RepID=UPI0006EBC450|nr:MULTISPECIES: hypothetical protein [Streptomyces]PWG09510.1 hypothetical protein DF268_31840 [Streptomyces sp. V2]
MSDHYKVDFEALGKLVADLAGCAQSMRSTMRQLEDIGPSGTGSAELESACDHFQEKWGHGIKQIADATDTVTERVAQAGRLYQGTEDEVVKLVSAVKTVDKTMRAGDR